VKIRSGLLRLNWKSVLIWLPLPLIAIAVLSLIAGAAGPGPAGGLLFFAIVAEAALCGLQVEAVRKWRSDRAQARMAVETDDIAALKDARRVREIRRRVRRRLIRRAFGVLVAAPLLALGILVLVLVNLHELAGAPGPVLMVSTIAIAVLFPIGLIWLCWRRWSDLFGDPIVLRGQAVAAAGSTQAAPPEEPEPELVGTDVTSELSSPTLLVQVTAGWRLTRDRGATPANQLLGQREVQLVSGAVRAVPRGGTVVLICSSRGRCIGRLGRFDVGEHVPGRRRWLQRIYRGHARQPSDAAPISEGSGGAPHDDQHKC
jgi:hypothetical protein